MTSKWRRYETLFPLRLNNGRAVPLKWLAEATQELVAQFGGASQEKQPIEGQWLHAGVLFRDKLVRIVVDVPDSPENRKWMKQFKARWKARLKQLELWISWSCGWSVIGSRSNRGHTPLVQTVA